MRVLDKRSITEHWKHNSLSTDLRFAFDKFQSYSSAYFMWMVFVAISCIICSRDNLCAIYQKNFTITHICKLCKRVFICGILGERVGGGVHGIITTSFFESTVSVTGRGQLVTCVLTWCPKVYVYWQPDQWSRAAFTWTFRGFVYESLSPHACRLQLLNSEFRRHGRLVTPGLECLWHEHQMEFYKLHICKIWYK